MRDPLVHTWIRTWEGSLIIGDNMKEYTQGTSYEDIKVNIRERMYTFAGYPEGVTCKLRDPLV